jgi:hypothetical protein
LSTDVKTNGLSFYAVPSENNVRDYIDDAAGCNVDYWGEIQITINQSTVPAQRTIILTPINGSLHYSDGAVTIKYTLPS